MEVSQQQVEQLAGLLAQLLVPDNAVIQQAYEQLKGFFRDRRVIVALAQVLNGSPEWSVRQLSAVLLRQRLMRSWTRVPAANQVQIKQLLLTRVLTDEKLLVRQSVADIIAVVAKHEIAAKKWPDLLGFLTRCCQSTQVLEREIGFYLLGVLAESMSEQLRPHLIPLLAMLARALRDQETVLIRVNAFSALKEVALELSTDADIDRFRQLIPTMIETLQEFVARGDDDSASRAFEVFDELVESEIPVLAKHMNIILSTFMQLAVNQNLEDSSRIKAIAFIAWAAEFKPKSITKHKLAPALTSTLFTLLFEDEDEPSAAGSEPGLAQAASQTLEMLATSLSPDQIIPIVIENARQVLHSHEPAKRKAAVIALAVTVEGSADFYRSRLELVLPMILQGLRDPHPPVREVACLTLTEFAEHVQPEMSNFHGEIMSTLFQILQEQTTPRIREKACVALEVVVEQLGDHILPYLQPLMEMLVVLLQSNQRAIQETVICAIGSAAHAAGDKFAPYLTAVVQTLSTAMTLSNDDEIELRALATDTIGQVATAVGLAAFEPFLQPVFQMALDGLEKINEPRLRECTWGFFASMARLCEAKFEMFLPVVMPRILASAKSNEGMQKFNENDEDDHGMNQFAKALVAEGDDDEDYDDDDGNEDDGNEASSKMFTILSEFVYEKEMAVASIGEIFLHVGQPFLPYVDESLGILVDVMENNLDYEVRECAVVAIGQFIRSFNNIFMAGARWQDTKVNQIHPDLAKLIDYIMPKLIHVLETESESAVCTAVCIVISDHLPIIGPAMISNVGNQLGQVMLLILQQQTPCQQTMDDDDDEDEQQQEEEEEDDEEHNAEKKALLIDTAADVIGATAGVLGPAFSGYFQAFLPHLLKFYKQSRPVSDRSMAIGCITEIVFGLKEGSQPYAEPILNLYLRGIRDPNDEVVRNSAYGLGGLCESLGPHIAPHYMQILSALQPLFSPEIEDSVRDNACSAVARMILANPGAIPLAQVLPVLLQWLPLREDLEETESVISCLLFLLNSENPILLSALPHTLGIFASALSPPMEQLSLQAREKVIAGLRQFVATHQPAFSNVFAGLAPEHQTVLTSILQQ